MASSEHRHVVIVGAGFSGLAAAKTYLEIDPSVNLLIVDADSGIGGVWSSSRIYPGLEYEVPTPMMNFSDFDIRKELGLGDWVDVSGEQINEYVVRYAQKFDILRRCRLDTEVIKIEKKGNHWNVLARSRGNSNEKMYTLICDKLIVATGLNSKPRMPDVDMSKFNGFSFHAKDMAYRHPEMTAEGVNHVTVVGGHKSALEAVGTIAQAGKQVECLMREGNGATWMMASRRPDGSSAVTPTTKRFMKLFTTSVYESNRWLDRFFHSGKSWLGTWCITWFWGLVTRTIQQDRYSKSANGAKLKPCPPTFFWFVPGGTILHERDNETLRLVDEENLIRVNRQKITSASGNSIGLSNGEEMQTDGVVFCTGWDLTIPPLFPAALASDLGLAVHPESIPKKEREYWSKLDSSAEKTILNTYPILQTPPSSIHIPQPTISPFRHYRAMVPSKLAACGDNSIVFLGNYATGKIQTTAEIYSLWAVAYLENLLPDTTKSTLQNKKMMDEDIALNEAYRKKRYLSVMNVRISFAETFEHDANVLRDLGLRSDRKTIKIPTGWRGCWGLKGWSKEWFEGYYAEDFTGLVAEFLKTVEKREGKGRIVNGRTPLVNGAL